MRKSGDHDIRIDESGAIPRGVSEQELEAASAVGPVRQCARSTWVVAGSRGAQ